MKTIIKNLVKITISALVVCSVLFTAMCAKENKEADLSATSVQSEPAKEETLTVAEEKALSDEYALQSEERITEENLEDALASLEKEINADLN